MTALTARFRRLTQPNIPPWLILLVILTSMAAIIWGTLGLKTTTLFEHWGLFKVLSQGFSPFDTSVVGEPTRFLLDPFLWIGYAITPDSFLGLNIYNVIIFIVQGMMTYALIRRLRPGNPTFALAVAVLFLIHPADTGLANSRYTGYHINIIFLLLSIYCLVDYWQYRNRLSLLGMLVASLLNFGIVEISYPLVFLTPLLLIWWEPAHRLTRRTFRVAMLWYIVPLLTLTESIVSTLDGRTIYQNSLLQTGTQFSFLARLVNFAGSLGHAYIRILVESWALTFQHIDFQSSRFSAAVVIMILVAISLFVVGKADIIYQKESSPPQSPVPSTSRRFRTAAVESNITWFIVGLAVIGLGFVIYAFLPSHQDFTERVYLLSSLGGAIIFPVLASWIGRLIHRERLVIVLGTAILTGIALQAGLVDVLRTTTASEQEQVLFAQIATQAPNLDRTKVVLIIDPTHQFSTSLIINISTPANILMKTALYYIYHNYSFDFRVCDPSVPPQPPSDFFCTLGTHDVRFSNGNDSPDSIYPLDSVVAFTYEGEEKLTLLSTWPTANAAGYNPSALIGANTSPPERITSLFARWPFQMQNALNEHPQQSIYFDQNSLIMFMDAPTLPYTNYGWIGNWTASTRSTLDVWLSADRDYQIKTVISHSTLPETLKNITLTVNDQPISLNAQKDANGIVTLTGTIPRAVVARDLTNTRITFLSSPVTSPLAAGTGTDAHYLGFQVDQFSVTPVSAPSS